MDAASLSIPLPMRNLTAWTYSSDPLVSLSKRMRMESIIPARSPASMLARIMSLWTLTMFPSVLPSQSRARDASPAPNAASAASTNTNGGASMDMRSE